MAIQKFLNLEGLSVFLDNLRSTFSPSRHTHTKSEITDLTVDSSLSATSTNPVQNSTVTAALDAKVPTTRTINGKSLSSNISLSPADVGADPTGTASSAVATHNTTTDAHNDIRLELKAINDRLNAFFDSDDKTLDELSEIVAYITNNKTLIDSITTSKVNVEDVINNLTTNVANKPLSAAQGVALKGLIDSVSTSLSNYQPKGNYALKSELPTKVSQLSNDSGYLTEHQDISGKLDSSALPTAINTALAQAKASGEFDGANGKDGTSVTVKSVSESTSDGGTNTITFSDGKTINVKNGSKGSKGDTGAKGQSIYVKKITMNPDGGAECDPTSLTVGDLVISSTNGDVYQTNAVHGAYAELSYTGLCIMGQQGIQGLPGSNGTSATHSWNGTTLTITSASGTSSANLKGDKGDTGSKGDKGDTGSKGDKGDKGDAGKTPVRGTDYWTASDIAQIKSYVDEAILGGAW